MILADSGNRRVLMERIAVRWHAPTHAIPVDLFRILVGLLSCAYFAHLFAQARDFSSPGGLIDHGLTREIFWYTRLGLFHPGMDTGAFLVVFALAIAASCALVAGYRPKLMAAFMFTVAVSAYRWNFLVIYVDDAIMHLVLFWMMMLPVGRTLALGDWLSDRPAAAERWKREMVPGGTLRAFLISLALVYVVAGAWKWTSPMWRDGTALYAALRTPISLAPEFWGPQHLTALRWADYSTLVLEPLFPVMFLLPVNHRLKWALLVAMIAFHAGIVATMRIPYANLACLAAAVIIFREEIMCRIPRTTIVSMRVASPPRDVCATASLAFVTLLSLAMVGDASVPAWRSPTREARTSRVGTAPVVKSGAPESEARAGFLGTQHNPLYSPLWLIGIAQSYRLFDWIDDRNFHIHYTVVERLRDGTTRPIDATELFPQSIRAVLLQTYMHGVTWGKVPSERADDLRVALHHRFAQRFCRKRSVTGEVEVSAAVARISPELGDVLPASELIARFSCDSGAARLQYVRLGDGRGMAIFRPRRPSVAQGPR